MRRRGKEIHFEGNNYPQMDKKAKDLIGGDVQPLVGLYKQVVTRYSMLSKALCNAPILKIRSRYGDVYTRG